MIEPSVKQAIVQQAAPPKEHARIANFLSDSSLPLTALRTDGLPIFNHGVVSVSFRPNTGKLWFCSELE